MKHDELELIFIYDQVFCIELHIGEMSLFLLKLLAHRYKLLMEAMEEMHDE